MYQVGNTACTAIVNPNTVLTVIALCDQSEEEKSKNKKSMLPKGAHVVPMVEGGHYPHKVEGHHLGNG